MSGLGTKRLLAAVVLGASTAACAGAPAAGTGPTPNPEYAALPDTLVCVVDRSDPRGLTELAGKLDGDEVVVLVDGEVRPLDAVHPVNVIAGYAGRESWLTQGEPVQFGGRGYMRTGGERRVGLELLERVGEHRGILLFAGADDDSPYDALYVPTAPTCIFQAYVRDDLIRG